MRVQCRRVQNEQGDYPARAVDVGAASFGLPDAERQGNRRGSYVLSYTLKNVDVEGLPDPVARQVFDGRVHHQAVIARLPGFTP